MIPKTIHLLELEKKLLEIAPEIAKEALRWYHTPVAVEQKRDRTLVSLADRSIELYVRDLLKKITPSFGFVGEEFGRLYQLASHDSSNEMERQSQKIKNPLDEKPLPHLNIDTDTHWLLDPIDGTINFLSHVPLWSTLLALIVNGEPVLGLVLFPAIDELFIASKDSIARYGTITSCQREFDLKPCAVAQTVTLDDAHLSCSSPLTFGHRGLLGWYQSLLQRPGEFRTHSDAFGYTRVLRGTIHGMIDCMAAPYDLAAVQILFDRTPGAYFVSIHSHSDPLRYRRGGAMGVNNKSLAESLFKDLRLWAATSPLHIKNEKSPLPVTASQLSLLLERAVQSFLGEHDNLFIEDVSLAWESTHSFELEASNGMADGPPHLGVSQGFRCRAIINGATGMASMVWDSKLQETAVTQLLETALQAAMSASRLHPSEHQSKSILASRDQVLGQFGASFPEIQKAKSFFGYGQALEHSQKPISGLFENVVSSIQVRVGQNAVMGCQVFLDGSQQTICRVESNWSITATGDDGHDKRKHTVRGFSNKQLSQEDWARMLFQDKEKVCQDVYNLMKAAYVPENIEYDYLLVDADLLGLILHEAIGHAAEGDLIQTGCSGFGNSQGIQNIQVAPPWMDVVIDGAIETCGQSLVDDEGVVSIRKILVEKGLLKTAIHSRATAKALGGIPDGACRSQTILHPSLDRMTNIWIQVDDSHRTDIDIKDDIECDNPQHIKDLLRDSGVLKPGVTVLYLSGWKGGTASCSNLEFRVDVQKVYKLSFDNNPKLLHHANFTGSAIKCLQAAQRAYGPTLCHTIGICGKDGQHVPTSDGGPSLLLLKKSNGIHVVGLGGDDDVSQ